jgi:hypothetical protein
MYVVFTREVNYGLLIEFSNNFSITIDKVYSDNLQLAKTFK